MYPPDAPRQNQQIPTRAQRPCGVGAATAGGKGQNQVEYYLAANSSKLPPVHIFSQEGLSFARLVLGGQLTCRAGFCLCYGLKSGGKWRNWGFIFNSYCI